MKPKTIHRMVEKHRDIETAKARTVEPHLNDREVALDLQRWTIFNKFRSGMFLTAFALALTSY